MSFRMHLIPNLVSRGLDHNRFRHNCVLLPKSSPLPPFCFGNLSRRIKHFAQQSKQIFAAWPNSKRNESGLCSLPSLRLFKIHLQRHLIINSSPLKNDFLEDQVYLANLFSFLLRWNPTFRGEFCYLQLNWNVLCIIGNYS